MAFNKMHQHLDINLDFCGISLDKISRNRIMCCSLEECVYEIAQLPFNLPILLESEAEKQMSLITKQKYQSASLWLRHMLLGETLQPEAYQPPALNYKLFAKFLAATFHLATSVHSRTANPLFIFFPSPTALWYFCVLTMSQNHLQYRGLTGVPYLLGKREVWEALVKLCSSLKSLSYQPEPLPRIAVHPTIRLMLEAQAIAKTDNYFYRHHLVSYVQTIRQIAKTTKESKDIQFHWLLPDGRLFVTGEKKKLPRINHREVPKSV